MTLTFHSTVRGDLSTSLRTSFIVVAVHPLFSDILRTFITYRISTLTFYILSVAAIESYVSVTKKLTTTPVPIESGICKQSCN